MKKFLGAREGAISEQDSAENTVPKFLNYLTAIFLGQQDPSKVGARTLREMRTLAEALDSLAEGNLPYVADLLVQRFKACESSTVEGWDVAQHLELISDRSMGLASLQEQQVAGKARLLKAKLDDAKKKHA